MTTEISLRLRDLKPEYQRLWNICQIKPENLNQAQEIVEKICSNRRRYRAVQRQINVPWYFIGVIHNMESSLKFTKHLHNGNSLKKRTVNVPSGRPVAEPINGWEIGYTWEESAIDALTLKEFDQVKDWSLAAQLWQIEKYNGFGYRMYHPEVLSPYLWSATNFYTQGKYTSDGKWDGNAVSAQIGVVALLKILLKVENLQIPLA
jgi:lysozyme family protein